MIPPFEHNPQPTKKPQCKYSVQPLGCHPCQNCSMLLQALHDLCPQIERHRNHLAHPSTNRPCTNRFAPALFACPISVCSPSTALRQSAPSHQHHSKSMSIPPLPRARHNSFASDSGIVTANPLYECCFEALPQPLHCCPSDDSLPPPPHKHKLCP